MICRDGREPFNPSMYPQVLKVCCRLCILGNICLGGSVNTAHGTIVGAGVADGASVTVPVLNNMATMDVNIVVLDHIN